MLKGDAEMRVGEKTDSAMLNIATRAVFVPPGVSLGVWGVG